jgi:hypothetical protein
MNVKAARLFDLAEVFETAAKQNGNTIDPPFDCVAVNLKPASWAEVGEALRHLATIRKYREDADAYHRQPATDGN